MNGVVRNIKALSIQTTGQLPRLTKGQKELLKTIRNCIENSKPLTFELIVQVYYNNVRKKFYIGEGWERVDPNDWRSGRYSSYSEWDILECFRKEEKLYKFKSAIKLWFTSNIGILVIKNQLVIIPTIDLGPEDEKENG